MIPIPGKHKQPLTTPVDAVLFLDIVQLVESKKLHDSNI